MLREECAVPYDEVPRQLLELGMARRCFRAKPGTAPWKPTWRLAVRKTRAQTCDARMGALVPVLMEVANAQRVSREYLRDQC